LYTVTVLFSKETSLKQGLSNNDILAKILTMKTTNIKIKEEKGYN